MKQLILYVILINVFAGALGSRRLAAARVGAARHPDLPRPRRFGVGAIFAVIDNSFSKLRLFKITEFMAAAFLLAVLAVLVLYLGGG